MVLVCYRPCIIYLALCEIYHTISAQIPMNVTLRKWTVCKNLHNKNGIFTLFDAPFQETLPCVFTGSTSEHYNSIGSKETTDFHYELFPVHSPLLRKSLLFSFPPLNYMLKFSGYPHRTSSLLYVTQITFNARFVITYYILII